MNELTNSTSTPSFGKNIPSSTITDPTVLQGWGSRAYNTEISVSGQHELAPRVSVGAGWFRRKFGNQTVTVDNRYSIAKGSYDGPFCANAPADPNLPGGGGYQVCGLYDLKPAVVAQQLPTSSTLQFSSNFGGETNIYEGFDFSTTSRFGNGAFVNAGITMGKRIFDQCNLVNAGIMAAVITAATEVAEVFPDGTKACHQDLPYRPDFKLHRLLPAAARLPDQRYVPVHSRRAERDGGGTSVLATWATTPATATTIGQFRTPATYSAGATTKSVNLIANGQNYGFDDLKQLDLRLSKRFKLDQVPLPCRLRCVQSVQQRLAVLAQQHVLDRGHQQLAEADERAAGPVLQDRRAVRLLTVERGARRTRRDNIALRARRAPR